MTPWLAMALGAQVLAAVSAIMLARRRTEHVPAAVALVLLAATTLLHAPILAALRPVPRPIEGFARVLVYLDGAITLAQYAPAAGLAVAVAVSPERRRRVVALVLGVWALASVVLAALYPSPLVRGAGLQRVYLAADLIGLFVATGALITWARAGIAAKRSPGSAGLVALALVLLDAAILAAPFSPWRGSVYGIAFDGLQLFITLSFATLAAAQVIAWRFLAEFIRRRGARFRVDRALPRPARRAAGPRCRRAPHLRA